MAGCRENNFVQELCYVENRNLYRNDCHLDTNIKKGHTLELWYYYGEITSSVYTIYTSRICSLCIAKHVFRKVIRLAIIYKDQYFCLLALFVDGLKLPSHS